MPGGAGGQLVALEQHGVGPAGLRQVVGDRGADRAAADHHRAHMASASLASAPSRRAVSSRTRRGRKAAGPTLGAPIATRRAAAAPGRGGGTAGSSGRCDACAFRRRSAGRDTEGDRHETARNARGRGARARRLRRIAGGAADDLGRHASRPTWRPSAAARRSAYWQNLSADLETAIASQFVGRIDPAGTRINVDVDEISLNSPFTSGATAETARLSGRVELVNPDGTTDVGLRRDRERAGRASYLPAGQQHRRRSRRPAPNTTRRSCRPSRAARRITLDADADA